jgi:hypothetical protein
MFFFQVRHPRCIQYKLKICIIDTTLYFIILHYNSATCFGPICRAIFRRILEQLECKIDNDFNLRDLVLQEVVKIILVCYMIEIRMC